MSSAPATLYVPRRLRRAPRSQLRLVCASTRSDVLVGLAVRVQLADVYESLAAVETNPQRRECLTLWAASARGSL